MEATHGSLPVYAYDRAKQATRAESDRPYALRQAIMSCRNGGVVSVIGVYGGFVDKFPAGAWMNRGLTLRTGQCHVQRYMKPLLGHIESRPPRPDAGHHAHPAAHAGTARLRHVQVQEGQLREGRPQALTRAAMTSGNHRPRARDATSHGPAAPGACQACPWAVP